MKGSGTGKMLRYINDEKNILGAGGYGIVIENTKRRVSKLFFDIDSCKEMMEEALITNEAKKIIDNLPYPVSVPKLWEVYNKNLFYKGKQMLCGIQMERIYPPSGYDSQFHILCGSDDDIDMYWGKRISEPVSEINPPRGFFAGPDLAEELWEKEGFDFTIEKYCETMGAVCGSLLKHGILPIDLEFVYSNHKIWVIDFGLCKRVKKNSIDPMEFYTRKTTEGLGTDLYVPHKGMEGYDSFLKAYLYYFNK
jgi:tRNA A-37 threonylcarbamoyl transferase component Bud32